MRYLVTYVEQETLLAAAKAAGWQEGKDSVLDYEPPEYHQQLQPFRTYAEAFAFAKRMLERDFFGQVEIEEQRLTVEPMDDGGPPLRGWETTRFRHICHSDNGEWCPRIFD